MGDTLNSVLIREYQASLELPRLDFLITEPEGTRIGVEVRYFNTLRNVYIHSVISDMLSIMEKGQGLDKMIVFIVTGDFSNAISMLEMLENKISIPENVSLIIGYLKEPDRQFYHVATLPREP